VDEVERFPIDPYIYGAEQNCFGCGPHNEHGMRLQFFVEGDEVVTELQPRDGWEGPPGIVHGGLQATLADEVAAWTILGLRRQFGFTTQLNVRYIRPLRLDAPIQGRGRIVEQSEKTVTVAVTLSQHGRRACTAKANFIIPTEAMAERALGRDLPDVWRAMARKGTA